MRPVVPVPEEAGRRRSRPGTGHRPASRCLVTACLASCALLSACAHRGHPPLQAAAGTREEGLATWYGEPYHGRRTASGAVYDMYGLSAAHRTLPFGTRVRVTRRDTGAAVEVPVTDRGPFVRGRIVDLSYGAARRIGLDRDGVAPVVVEVLDRASAGPTPAPSAVPAPCFWVQVGAFSELDNARRSRRRLEEAGEQAVVSEGPRGLLRVRAGPFASADEAGAALARVRPGWPEAQVFSCSG